MHLTVHLTVTLLARVAGSWLDRLRDLWGIQRMSLKLVCEHCSGPVPCGQGGRGYTFTRPNDTLVRLLPLMQVRRPLVTIARHCCVHCLRHACGLSVFPEQASMKVLQVANFALAVGRFFSPGLPSVPADVMDKLNGFVERVR